MPCQRPPAPPILDEAPAWTRRLLAQGGPFRWPVREGRPVNQALRAPLLAMSDGHCAYCDGFPLDAFTQPTIDHFRPKARFPALAFAWDNLFICCTACQAAKADEFDEALLRPDVEDYQFFRFFTYDTATGGLRPNSLADPVDQARAACTIALFELNAPGRRADRRRWVRRGAAEAPADRPYRYLFTDSP